MCLLHSYDFLLKYLVLCFHGVGIHWTIVLVAQSFNCPYLKSSVWRSLWKECVGKNCKYISNIGGRERFREMYRNHASCNPRSFCQHIPFIRNWNFGNHCWACKILEVIYLVFYSNLLYILRLDHNEDLNSKPWRIEYLKK